MQQVVRAPLHLVEGKRIRGREPEAHFDLGKKLADRHARHYLKELARAVEEVHLPGKRQGEELLRGIYGGSPSIGTPSSTHLEQPPHRHRHWRLCQRPRAWRDARRRMYAKKTTCAPISGTCGRRRGCAKRGKDGRARRHSWAVHVNCSAAKKALYLLGFAFLGVCVSVDEIR